MNLMLQSLASRRKRFQEIPLLRVYNALALAHQAGALLSSTEAPMYHTAEEFMHHYGYESSVTART